MKRILIVFLIALAIAVIMFLIKEQPFSAGPKVPDHEHEPGIIEEHEH